MKTYELQWVTENDNCTRYFLATTKAILEEWEDGKVVYASGFNNLEELKKLLDDKDLVISNK